MQNFDFFTTFINVFGYPKFLTLNVLKPWFSPRPFYRNCFFKIFLFHRVNRTMKDKLPAPSSTETMNPKQCYGSLVAKFTRKAIERWTRMNEITGFLTMSLRLTWSWTSEDIGGILWWATTASAWFTSSIHSTHVKESMIMRNKIGKKSLFGVFWVLIWNKIGNGFWKKS